MRISLIVITERPTAQVRDRITSLIVDINLAYDTNLSELIVDQETWDTGWPAALPIRAEIEQKGFGCDQSRLKAGVRYTALFGLQRPPE